MIIQVKIPCRVESLSNVRCVRNGRTQEKPQSVKAKDNINAYADAIFPSKLIALSRKRTRISHKHATMAMPMVQRRIVAGLGVLAAKK